MPKKTSKTARRAKTSAKPATSPSKKKPPRTTPAARASKSALPAHTNTSPLAAYCRSLPGVTEDIKWGDDLVYSVGPKGHEKMFAAFDLEDTGELGFKCDDADFDRLTDVDGIIPAPYAARFGWVKVTRRGILSDDELKALLRKSYDLVLAKLPARARRLVTDPGPAT